MEENFILDKAKFFGIAVAIAKNFNVVQNKILPMSPIKRQLNKSNKVVQSSIIALVRKIR